MKTGEPEEQKMRGKIAKAIRKKVIAILAMQPDKAKRTQRGFKYYYRRAKKMYNMGLYKI